MIYHVKDAADLEQQLSEAGSKLVVIHFFAEWCGPCMMMMPKIAVISKVETDVVFLNISLDECEDLGERYAVSSMPTFTFIKNKKEVDRFTGALADKLKNKVEKLKNA